MKKLIFALVASLALFASDAPPALQSLLNRFGIEATQSKESIVRETQRLWLRKSGQERWDLPTFESSDREGLLIDLRSLGYIDETPPLKKSYDYCLFLGAAIPSMEKRLEYLGDLWNRGVRFNQLVFLASDRPLSQKGDQTLPNENYKNEMEALVFLFKNSSLPCELKNLPLKTVVATRDIGRANTADTVRAWLEINPTPGSALAISTQPHVKYQEAVLLSILPNTFSVETVGPGAPNSLNLAVALDACARTLYVKLESEKKSLYAETNEKPWNCPSSAKEHATRKQAPASH